MLNDVVEDAQCGDAVTRERRRLQHRLEQREEVRLEEGEEGRAVHLEQGANALDERLDQRLLALRLRLGFILVVLVGRILLPLLGALGAALEALLEQRVAELDTRLELRRAELGGVALLGVPDHLAPGVEQHGERVRVRLFLELLEDRRVQEVLELSNVLGRGGGVPLLLGEDGGVEEVGHRLARRRAHVVHVLEGDERHEHARDVLHEGHERLLELERVRAQHVARRGLLLECGGADGDALVALAADRHRDALHALLDLVAVVVLRVGHM
mmetsp:Transcript_2355/g.6586  ORF Transcript_2355/g.6586 Transcript_2355/m.6586 type:complete len:271 (-) Transcript_2355:1964-2776(-)